MEYKRLTPRDLVEVINSNDKENIAFLNYAMRLHTLEDKIENGTLVELPCKVGDTVYHLSDKKISEELVKQIKYITTNGEIDLLNSYIMTDDNYSKDYNFYRLSKLGKSLFLTKSQAEEKLKELKENKCNT